MNEPDWKRFLNWAAVLTWFMMPFVVFVMQLTSEEGVSWFHFHEHLKEFSWLGHYYGDLTLLVFGLAGMHLVDKKLPTFTGAKEEK